MQTTKVAPAIFSDQAIARDVVEFVGTMHGKGESDREDSARDEADGRRSSSEVHVQVMQPIRFHPAADHHCLDKIENREHELTEVGSSQPQREQQALEVRRTSVREHRQVSLEGNPCAGLLDIKSRGELSALLARHVVRMPVGRIDRRHPNVEVYRPELPDFAKNEGVRDSRIPAYEVSNAHTRNGGCIGCRANSQISRHAITRSKRNALAGDRRESFCAGRDADRSENHSLAPPGHHR